MESIVTLEGIDCWLRHQDSNERLHVDVPAIGNSLPEDCGPGEYYHRALWAIDTLGLIPIFKERYFQGN